jgi:hypothetical protein
MSRASWSRTVFRWVTTSTCRFFKVCSTDISTPRVWAPASDCDPKLTLRAMTVGRRARSARLFSAGMRRSSAQC